MVEAANAHAVSGDIRHLRDHVVHSDAEITVEVLDEFLEGADVAVVGGDAFAVRARFVGVAHSLLKFSAVPHLSISAINSILKRKRLISLRFQPIDAQSVEPINNHNLLLVDSNIPYGKNRVVRASVLAGIKVTLHFRDVTGLADVEEDAAHYSDQLVWFFLIK